jgi:hypothetical protein
MYYWDPWILRGGHRDRPIGLIPLLSTSFPSSPTVGGGSATTELRAAAALRSRDGEDLSFLFSPAPQPNTPLHTHVGRMHHYNSATTRKPIL